MSKTINMTLKTLVSGTAAFSMSENQKKAIAFTPKSSVDRCIKGFNGNAYVTVARNGKFLVKLRYRDRSKTDVIKRMNHGCLTRTRDNAILLTLKIFHPEENDVSRIIVNESWEAAKAYTELTNN